MSEENKDAVRRYFEQVNAHRLDLLEQFFAKDVTAHMTTGPVVFGRDDLKGSVAIMLDAVPDLQITIEDLIAEGDRVVLRNTYSGTRQKEYMGIPATGKHVVWSTIWIFRLAGGKIVEMWWQSDIMQQVGMTLPTGQGGG